jgi:uncharacterized membrane protein YqiK
VSYRDDREALRQRNEDLEQELARARTQIEKLKGRPPEAVDVAKRQAPPAGRRSSVPTALGLILVVVLGSALEVGMLPVAAVASSLLAALVLGRLLVVAGPHEAVVLSGVARQRRDGSRVGYRVVHESRVLRRPVVETATCLDLGLFVVEVVVPDAAMKSGVRAEARLGACAKIDSKPELLDRAVERFLGQRPEELAEVVRAVIVGAARSALSRVAFDAVVARPESVVADIREETQAELQRMGLTLWTLELYSIEEEGG